jgi:serine/threonine-protein kinase
MEYIDGEDLSSLLRRIGRLPQDKAVQIARQLCAGVAAAHDRGVLHRDLKPANVMIDGDGDARVTDFGVATAVSDATHEFAGTPQYMAPELFAGQPASVQSDVYALGLTLYELFTGRRAYDSKTVEGLKQAHQTGTLPTPTTIVRDLDPAIERAILRCVEKDPARRPASALAVAAMLPGADALADALAAGETPSPELLAAAGESEALPVWRGVATVVPIMVSLLIFAGVSGRVSIFGRTPHELPPAVLVDRAEAVISVAGYTNAPADEAYEIAAAGAYVNWLRNNRFDSDRLASLATGTPSGLQFWYRSSPRELAALSGDLPTLTDPPQELSGMQSVVLDGAGRLQQFRAVPPQRDDTEGDAPAADWTALFRAAGLEATAYVPVAPQWTPRDYADARFAWEGALPGLAGQTLRIEAGSYGGRPVSFQLVTPWTAPTLMVPRATDPIDRVFLIAAVIFFAAVVAAAVVLARRNLRQDRADRRGAARVSAAISLTVLASWTAIALYAGITPLASHFRAASTAAFFGVLVWTLYVALEPYARRFWPHALLGWSRLLAGHVRDARVGRDVLIGILVGTLLAYGDVLRSPVMAWLGYREPQPVVGNSLRILLGPGPLISEWLTWAFIAMFGALLIVLGLVLARLLLRRMWLVIAVASFFLAFTDANFMGTSSQWMWLFPLTAGVVVALATVRYGLLALAVSRFVWYILTRVPMTGDFSHWSAAPSNWSLALIVVLACFGFYASRAGQPLFGRVLKD